MTSGQNKQEKGFTIIEVVLVLAIAGLIFLIVFLALPQLQRSRRDTQRRNDAGRMLASLESYAGNNNGNYPAANATAWGTFSSTYLPAAEYSDPQNGPYGTPAFSGNLPGNTPGNLLYRAGQMCNPAAEGVTNGGSRDVAIIIRLEQGTYCQDNR